MTDSDRQLDRVVGHLEEYYTVSDDGIAHLENLEPGKYALVRFDDDER